MTRVVWLGDRSMCLDQHMLDGLLTGPAWEHERGEWSAPLEGDGAVVIVPARFYSPAMVNHATSLLAWCVVVLTSDEESLFDHEQLAHPNMRVWVMTPRPGRHAPGYRFLGEGFHRDTPTILRRWDALDRSIDVSFAGQITHERREAMMAAVEQLDDLAVSTVPTSGFMQGLPLPEYLDLMVDSRIVLCPSGPATPDSFRTYEALEAGCVPIVDGHCPAYPEAGYWQLVHGDVPFPIVDDWSMDLEPAVRGVLADWPAIAARCQAWWGRRKQATLDQLIADVLEVAPHLSDPRHHLITVVVPTSPTPEDPDHAKVRMRLVLQSIRERLPSEPIVVSADGVRPEQAHLRAAYMEHLRWLAAACLGEPNVQLQIAGEWIHQAGVTRSALELVRTPLLLFVEHDMPLVGDLPFDQLVRPLLTVAVHLLRFGQDREDEQYSELMLDPEPVVVEGVPLRRTFQWSQRPHLASTPWYRHLLAKYFGAESRTMIEDVMHGVVAVAWHEHGLVGLDPFRLALYCPPGPIARSHHLDGRGDEPKFDMVYAYDGPTPEGAPTPTKERT